MDNLSINYIVIAIFIFIIIINNIIWKIVYKKKKIILNKPLTYKEVTDDLMQIINYKCHIAYRRVLQPLVKKAINSTPLINDKTVNKITVQITKELLDELSPEYIAKLKIIYKSDKMEDVLLEFVYNVITEMSLDINVKSIKKLNKINTFKSFMKNDIDSEDNIE